MKIATLALVALMFPIFTSLAAAETGTGPNFDGLLEETRAASAPVHHPASRSLTNSTAVGSGNALGRAAGVAVGSTSLIAALGPMASTVLRTVGAGVGGVALGAAVQYFLQGKIDWPVLVASAGGAMIAVALLNPATLPFTMLAGAVGGLGGEAVLHGAKAMWKSWTTGRRRSSPQQVASAPRR